MSEAMGYRVGTDGRRVVVAPREGELPVVVDPLRFPEASALIEELQAERLGTHPTDEFQELPLPQGDEIND